MKKVQPCRFDQQSDSQIQKRCGNWLPFPYDRLHLSYRSCLLSLPTFLHFVTKSFMALFPLQTADNEISPDTIRTKFPIVMKRGAPMKRSVLFLLSLVLLGGMTNAMADRRPPPRPSGGRGHRPPPRRPPPAPPRHHHTHTSFGFVIGGPLWSSPVYSPYYSYYPYGSYYPYPSQTIVIQSSPTRYIEKNENSDAGQDAGQYWYYCPNPKGYYPYVQKCNVNWQKVIPFPQDAQ